MYGLDRLIEAGMPEDVAYDTASWFNFYGNANDFERYMCELENGQRVPPRDT